MSCSPEFPPSKRRYASPALPLKPLPEARLPRLSLLRATPSRFASTCAGTGAPCGGGLARHEPSPARCPLLSGRAASLLSVAGSVGQPRPATVTKSRWMARTAPDMVLVAGSVEGEIMNGSLAGEQGSRGSRHTVMLPVHDRRPAARHARRQAEHPGGRGAKK